MRAFGLGAPSPRDKVDGLEEAIRIVRGLWTEPRFTLPGRLYRTENAPLEPKPEHRIPIWLGTYGPRALEVTGRLADGWIPSIGFAPPGEIPPMRDRVFEAARAAGRAPSEITCVYNVQIRVGGRADGPPDAVTGSADQVADELLGFVRLGFDGFNFTPAGPERAEQAELIASEIIPGVRGAV